MESGALRHRVTIQQDRGTAREPDGAHVPDWVTLVTCWAAGGPLAGRELWQARQAQTEITDRYSVRYSSDLADLTGSVRILFPVHGGARVLHVKDSRIVGERKRAIEFDCTEAPDRLTTVTPPDFYGFP